LKSHVAENSTALFYLAGQKSMYPLITGNTTYDCGMIYQKPKYIGMANCSEIRENKAFVLCDNATIM
jgi:hypothetical protein